MGSYKEVTGDLLALAKAGDFDVIAHGCNCQVTMGAGIALQMAKEFGANVVDKLFSEMIEGDIPQFDRYEKLGNVCGWQPRSEGYPEDLIVVNCYTQNRYGRNHPDGEQKPLNYTALRMCLDKMNYGYKGKRIGLPMIGGHLAGGDHEVIRKIIKEELKDCDVTVVIYKK